MKNLLEQLFALVDKNNKHNVFLANLSAKEYFDYMPWEIEEVIEQFKENNTVYLEDELWDILWIYMNLLVKLEREELITSRKEVMKRAIKKYSWRIENLWQKTIEERQNYWETVKVKQKEELKKEHNKKYN